MKRLINVIMLTLAMNFVVLAGAVGWLFQTKRLDREKVHAIRELIFAPATQPTTQPVASADPTTQPLLQLEELLARQIGRPAGEQVEFIRQSFAAQMAQLERRARELADLQRQIDLAKAQLARDREANRKEAEALAAMENQAAQLASDKGFQDTLALYSTMSAKQVKGIFKSLDEGTVVKYLQAMPPRTAAKIIAEFKSPDEIARIQSILEKIRQAQASATKE